MLSWAGIYPPGMAHMEAAAGRADADINIPDFLKQLRHCHAGEPGHEPLASLNGEDQSQIPAFHTVVQETIIADFLEAGREHMHQETPYKLFVGERDPASGVTRFFPPGGKGGFFPVDRQDTVVGNGNLVCVFPKIFDGIAKAIERLLNIRAPVFPVESVPEPLPADGCAQAGDGGGERKAAFLEKGIQQGKEFPLEFIPEDKDRDKKFPCGLTYPAVRRQPTAGDNTVHMDVVIQLLVPGVEHLDDAGCCPEVLRVCGKLQQCFGTAFVEESV